MKKLMIAFLLIPVMFSCNNDQDKVEELKKENQQLKKESSEKDSSINEFFKSFNEIEENLKTIKEKERLISKSTMDKTEFEEDIEEKINNDIALIYDLMKENKRTISRLNKQLKNSNLQIGEFENMIERLTRQIQRKDEEIALLKEELQNMNFAIENLNTIIDTLYENNLEQEKVIDKKTDELNKAYYAFGTEKELKENNVITKEGGIIGIGRVEKLKKDFNKDYFTEIDIHKMKMIEFSTKKADLITSHPDDSYKLIKKDNKIEGLKITKPEKFWQASKYLVIVVK